VADSSGSDEIVPGDFGHRCFQFGDQAAGVGQQLVQGRRDVLGWMASNWA
jgi:hypothetical protein